MALEKNVCSIPCIKSGACEERHIGHLRIPAAGSFSPGSICDFFLGGTLSLGSNYYSIGMTERLRVAMVTFQGVQGLRGSVSEFESKKVALIWRFGDILKKVALIWGHFERENWAIWSRQEV